MPNWHLNLFLILDTWSNPRIITHFLLFVHTFFLKIFTQSLPLLYPKITPSLPLSSLLFLFQCWYHYNQQERMITSQIVLAVSTDDTFWHCLTLFVTNFTRVDTFCLFPSILWHDIIIIAKWIQIDRATLTYGCFFIEILRGISIWARTKIRGLFHWWNTDQGIVLFSLFRNNLEVMSLSLWKWVHTFSQQQGQGA